MTHTRRPDPQSLVDDQLHRAQVRTEQFRRREAGDAHSRELISRLH